MDLSAIIDDREKAAIGDLSIPLRSLNSRRSTQDDSVFLEGRFAPCALRLRFFSAFDVARAIIRLLQ
jgi:hypothetical protein